MKLTIKNMVCDRCKMAVDGVLNEMQIAGRSVALGEVVLEQAISETQLNDFSRRIEALGFELIGDKKGQLIERIKAEIIDSVHHRAKEGSTSTLSQQLADRLHHDYDYLSHLFSSIEGITIEQYHIAQKIERVKELLVYDQLTLTQIAEQMGYSSVSHLSRQFKKLTGMSPSEFKRLRDSGQRQPLDKI